MNRDVCPECEEHDRIGTGGGDAPCQLCGGCEWVRPCPVCGGSGTYFMMERGAPAPKICETCHGGGLVAAPTTAETIH